MACFSVRCHQSIGFSMATTIQDAATISDITKTGNFTENDSTPIFNISETFLKQYRFVIGVILTPVVCTLGLLGNYLCFRVLRKTTMKRRMSIFVYLLARMITNIAYLALGLFLSINEIIFINDFYLGNYIWTHAGAIKAFVDIVLNHISAFLLIIMSLERLWLFIHPLTHQESCLSKYPRTVLFSGILVFCIYALPFPLRFRRVDYLTSDNITTYSLTVDPDFKHLFEITQFVETVVLYYIDPFTVLFTNFAIMFAYSRYLKQKTIILKKCKCDGKNQVKITVLVVYVCVMYIILSLPNLFIQTLLLADDRYSIDGKFSKILFLFYLTGDLFARINASIDFIIYMFASSH